MEENLIALLQMIEEFQAEYNVQFDILSIDCREVLALDKDWNTLASVERR